jgi:two-component sensor histidine kinase
MNNVTLQHIFGKRLKSFRKIRGLTQSELSEKSGVSLEYISKIERGLASPSFHIIDELAKALEVGAMAFFAEENPACILHLREINHRIKNNYQIIANLLSLGRDKAESAKGARTFEAIRTRVVSMSATHDLLAEMQNEPADFGVFLHKLFLRLKEAFGAEHVEIEFDIDEGKLPPPTAFALGLAANELFCNVLKHSDFNLDGRKVKTALKIDGRKGLLTIQNPAQGEPYPEKSELPCAGMSIVKSIVNDQLHGEFKFTTGSHAVAEISFPIHFPA